MKIISKANATETHEIATLMQRVHDNMEHPEWYICDDENYVRAQLSGGGCGVVIKDDGVIIASCICRFPGDSPDNLGRDIGVSELSRVVHMETIVVDVAYRGLRLQQQMLTFAESLLPPDSICLATVHPDNIASWKSFEKLGYTCVCTKLKYGGVLRRIYRKDLWK